MEDLTLPEVQWYYKDKKNDKNTYVITQYS